MIPLELRALLPFMILAAAPVAIMINIAIYRNHEIAFSLALGGIGFAILFLPVTGTILPESGAPLLSFDSYALFFITMILLAGIATLLTAFGYLNLHRSDPEEFYILILTALLGASILVSSVHLAAFFLGLEIMSVSLYALIAYEKLNNAGVEAGIKYFILAAFSSSFLIFGMALIYADSGILSFTRMSAISAEKGLHPILIAGVILISVGIGFKLAVVPFHMWVADVYEGAPAPVTGFIATVSKGAVFAVLLRFFLPVDVSGGNSLSIFFATVAIASMIIGNLLALFQDNVKRLLAYSSIAHMGYLLVAYKAYDALRITTVLFYLAAYFIANLGAFGVVTVLSNENRDADRIEDYRGLFLRRPWLAGAFTAMLLSLAGIPLTVGFIGKFTILAAGISNFLYIQVLILIATSILGLVYYLRILIALYISPANEAETAAPSALPMPIAILALSILIILLFGLGIYPGPLLDAISALRSGG
ncbi:MAG: NADH-quinone oxidoreductase subunit N [Smithella sp.]